MCKEWVGRVGWRCVEGRVCLEFGERDFVRVGGVKQEYKENKMVGDRTNIKNERLTNEDN